MVKMKTHTPERLRAGQQQKSPVERLLSGRRDALRTILEERPKGVSEKLWAECKDNAWKMLREYLEVESGQHVLFVTDSTPATDRRFITALQQVLNEHGVLFDELALTEETTRQQMLAKMGKAEIIWTATNFEIEPVEWDDLLDHVEKKKQRLAHCPGACLENLANGGALTEDRGQLVQRMAKMVNRLRGVDGFHITSSYGTDLWVRMKPDERRWCPLNGVIRPGKWGNLPEGEVFTTPDEEHVNGVLVVPVIPDDVTAEQGVDKFVHLTIHDGKIVRVDGGKSAEQLRKYLIEESEKEHGNPYNVLRCVEIAFGANSRARTADKPDMTYSVEGHGTIEMEKRLGTMHIAFGDSKHGEEGTEGHTSANTHLDFVIPRHGLTVTAFKSWQDFERRKNGENLITKGSWGF